MRAASQLTVYIYKLSIEVSITVVKDENGKWDAFLAKFYCDH